MNAPAYWAVAEDVAEARAAAEIDKGTGEAPAVLVQGLVLQDVTFSYTGRAPVISKLSLEIPANKTTAFVGGSGTGKSTVLDLILRLLQPDSGEILVDGRPLSSIGLKDWRRRVGYVAQETVLFHDTVLANITWARPDATREQVERAARLAHAHEFISRLPNGYDTLVGQRGAQLSGGERQRIALARALVTEPQLLVLDEATSNLDAESERTVQNAIDSLRSTMTILVVAHRLATVRHADVIYVLEGGRIAESGSWEELQSRGGRLAELWALQSDHGR